MLLILGSPFLTFDDPLIPIYFNALMPTSAQEKIHDLESQIEKLKQEAVLELKQKLAIARTEVSSLEKELAQLTGTQVSSASAAPRLRRPSISDDDLKAQILKAVAAKGQNGMNAKAIAEAIDQNSFRVRDFIKANPKILKRQGNGPGTRFYLP